MYFSNKILSFHSNSNTLLWTDSWYFSQIRFLKNISAISQLSSVSRSFHEFHTRLNTVLLCLTCIYPAMAKKKKNKEEEFSDLIKTVEIEYRRHFNRCRGFPLFHIRFTLMHKSIKRQDKRMVNTEWVWGLIFYDC